MRTAGPKIFGFEAEPWNSLENIFYRSVRYAVMKARHSRAPPDLTTLRGLVFDELDRKYRHERHLKYAEDESSAISWYLSWKKEDDRSNASIASKQSGNGIIALLPVKCLSRISTQNTHSPSQPHTRVT